MTACDGVRTLGLCTFEGMFEGRDEWSCTRATFHEEAGYATVWCPRGVNEAKAAALVT